MKNIRVLIVDDSLFFQKFLSLGISSAEGLEVVATAQDPYDARDKILKYKPDVMICDVEMPKMNGIEFIRKLIPQYPIPVIVVSSINGIVFDALDAGAVDFVAKPDMENIKNVELFILELIDKINIASKAKIIKNNENTNINSKCEKNSLSSKEIIAIGASTGGTEAILSILKDMPSNIPGVVVVQHIPPFFSKLFAERLNKLTNLEVKEAESGDYVEQGKVLIAPGNKHMRIKRISNKFKVDCFEGEKVNGHCPSIDVLFESVAKEAGNNAVGIILTGMGQDGAKGLLAMRRRGAYTIGQDESSSVIYGMPKVAFEIGAVCKQLPLSRIPFALLEVIK